MIALRTLISVSAAAAMLFISACTQEGGYSLDSALSTGALPGLKYGDHDPVAIKGRQPKTYDVHGIDISRYNPSINWQVAKRAGIAFAFIKATEGKDDGDPAYRQHWNGAQRAGIPRAAYHFYYFCASPEAQARNYIRSAPKSESSLPPILDVEWNPTSPTCRKRESAPVVVSKLKRWLKIVERHYGQKPIIYTTVDFYRDNLSRGELPGYQYWLRSVKAEPKFIYGKRPWVFWQYTGTGSVPGIEGKVDINVFNGNRSDWASWVKKNRR